MCVRGAPSPGPPAQLITSSSDIKRMLADLKREQYRFLKYTDLNDDGKVWGRGAHLRALAH